VITQARFAHALAGVEKFEQLNGIAPVPPDFTACIKHGEATSGSPTPPRSQLKAACEAQYQVLVKQALDPLISERWVIAEAAELDVRVGEAQLHKYLVQQEGGHSRAEVLEQLGTHGETLPEFVLESKAQLLAEGILHLIAHRTEHLTQAQIASYYDAHRSQFGTPPRRDLHIARTATEAEALEVKREIEAGESFASVVKRLPIEQPIFSKNGFLHEYRPGLYREPPLDRAIFAAKSDVLSGPVKIYLGSYVFEVTHVYPAVPEPLAQAQATIRAQLPHQLDSQALVAFIHSWRARWKARTRCSAGYLVPKCKGGPSEVEDPNTLS
jgi:hypothetical protein